MVLAPLVMHSALGEKSVVSETLDIWLKVAAALVNAIREDIRPLGKSKAFRASVEEMDDEYGGVRCF